MNGVRRRGLPLARISEDLGLDVVALGRSSSAVPWDVFASILDRLGEELGSPAELRRFAEEFIDADPLSAFKVVGRILSTPRDVYSLGVRWIGPSLFPMTRADLWEGPDGLLIERVLLDSELRDCPALFHLLHGALIALPQTWGHGPSEVTLDLQPRVATYTIRPCSVRRGFVSSVIRAVRTRLALPRMLRELESQQQAISASYRELREAHEQISAQAGDLRRVDALGRELSRDVDLDRVLDALVRILREDFEFAGVEIELAPIPSEFDEAPPSDLARLRPARRSGANHGLHEERLPFEAAGRRLGTLVIYGRPGRRHDDAMRVVSRLLPWIALAIDNALTYARIALHAETLETRVRERTARLEQTNELLLREIDERKRATDALLQSQAQLRASERLASIGTLAAGIAHEINNPIGAILAAAQLARLQHEESRDRSAIDAALFDIVAEAKRCGNIVRSVLRFARDERSEKWEYDANELAQRSVRLTSAFADQHATRVVFEGAGAPARILANPTQIEQAIVNLVRNAIESGGRVVHVRVAASTSEGRVAIEVCDDGSGIPESDRLRILEPFYTTRREDGGTGLGLSVVHGIAEDHGGSLAIESSEAGGTVVRLTLPLAAFLAPPNALPIEGSRP